MNQGEANKFLEEVRESMVVRPLDGPTLRATAFEIRFDGGAFTFHVYDNRESTEPRPLGPSKKWEAIEIARYAISPVALSRLVESLKIPLETYQAIMGRSIPSEAEADAGFKAFIAKVFKGTNPEK